MKKSELIKKLNETPGDPEVTFYNDEYHTAEDVYYVDVVKVDYLGNLDKKEEVEVIILRY